ncbi:MAG: imidazole glycerol phosphate synthase subunit HisF [Candidatus Micrarchaeia archaeon]
MLTRRIIPCLDCDLAVPKGRVVKGVKFKEIEYAGVPWELARKYSLEGADEIVLLDITASWERRASMVEVVKRTAKEVFIPLTVGGGVRSIEDFRTLLRAGADKCSINTAALENPELIDKASKIFGSQCVVVAIDAKRRFSKRKGWYECVAYGGRKFTGVDAVRWAEEVERRGAGEILLTSIDRDGTNKGYDIELIQQVSRSVSIPVIASGGCGNPAQIYELFNKTQASAALAASIFHFNRYSIQEVKNYLKSKGVEVRK